MSAVPYNPQNEKGSPAPYTPQNQYVQQQQQQQQRQNEIGIAYTQQNGNRTTTAYAPHSDTGIGYAPRTETTTAYYPPHEKSKPTVVPAVQPGVQPGALAHAQTAPPALTHPQSNPVYSPQPIRNAPAIQHAQHFTPPTGPTQEWQHSMCGCFDSGSICCIGFWAPCVLYSRTHRRLRTSPSTVRTFSCCNGVCIGAFCCGNHGPRQRDEIRYRYNLAGSGIGDCLRHCCCGPCTLCQEEMEVRDRERQATNVFMAGYQKPVQMAYARPMQQQPIQQQPMQQQPMQQQQQQPVQQQQQQQQPMHHQQQQQQPMQRPTQ